MNLGDEKIKEFCFVSFLNRNSRIDHFDQILLDQYRTNDSIKPKRSRKLIFRN